MAGYRRLEMSAVCLGDNLQVTGTLQRAQVDFRFRVRHRNPQPIRVSCETTVLEVRRPQDYADTQTWTCLLKCTVRAVV